MQPNQPDTLAKARELIPELVAVPITDADEARWGELDDLCARLMAERTKGRQ